MGALVVKVTNRSDGFRNPVINEPVGNTNADNMLQRLSGNAGGFVNVGVLQGGRDMFL
jgi:hypothetical protein